MTDTTTQEKIRVDLDLNPPSTYSVILLNDNETPMEFVISLLVYVFNIDFYESYELTSLIHQTGSGVAASGLTHELANHLRDLALAEARNASFPLEVELKEEN